MPAMACPKISISGKWHLFAPTLTWIKRCSVFQFKFIVMKNKILKVALCFASLILVFSCGQSQKEVRTRDSFNHDWKFLLGDHPEAVNADFDDADWRLLNLPHDWSIEGEFSADHPATPGGGALPGGIAWYRKSFLLPESDQGKNIYLEFDGIYKNGEVWINGHYLGIRPYGYSSFRHELTPYLNFGETPNQVSVKVDNSQQPNSRWYSGSGIYRNVWLVKTGPIAVDHWGTFVTTPAISESQAEVNIKVNIKNTNGAPETISMKSAIYDRNNKKVSEVISPGVSVEISGFEVEQSLLVKNPELWSIEDPAMYRVVTTLFRGSEILDKYETPFGIRSFEFHIDKGFLLNGKQVKIKGVCNHHDLGALGAAINTRALERQLEIMKAMGVNAIRTAHNPPAPELLDLCDRMGFIVMDEAFDVWRIAKFGFDYSYEFDEWHKRDLEDMVLRDRNHPSVMIWSIGNEILEQWDSTGIELTRRLAAIVRNLDSTRPITSGMNGPDIYNYMIRSGALDLIGFNYKHEDFEKFRETFPGQLFIGAETNSGLATRGSYDMPSDSIRRWPLRWDLPFTEGNPDLTCSSYDNCSTPWGSTHFETWGIIKKHDFLSGMFIWTGFDYLGEPTPYTFPARSSYFGVVDLAGFPKDAFYFYQSEWTKEPMLHLFPHWNWQPGQEIDVIAYSNCDEVELSLNGTSLGTQTKCPERFHFKWRVAFEPGVLEAIGKKDGTVILKQEVRTAGEPHRIILSADRDVINADGQDLSFVTVTVVDKDGIMVPDADNQVFFSLKGDGKIEAVDNGSQTSMEPFKAEQRRAFNGKCLVIVRSGNKPSNLMLKASSDGLQSAEIALRQTKN
jgi:beta-galactosidase